MKIRILFLFMILPITSYAMDSLHMLDITVERNVSCVLNNLRVFFKKTSAADLLQKSKVTEEDYQQIQNTQNNPLMKVLDGNPKDFIKQVDISLQHLEEKAQDETWLQNIDLPENTTREDCFKELKTGFEFLKNMMRDLQIK